MQEEIGLFAEGGYSVVSIPKHTLSLSVPFRAGVRFLESGRKAPGPAGPGPGDYPNPDRQDEAALGKDIEAASCSCWTGKMNTLAGAGGPVETDGMSLPPWGEGAPKGRMRGNAARIIMRT